MTLLLLHWKNGINQKKALACPLHTYSATRIHARIHSVSLSVQGTSMLLPGACSSLDSSTPASTYSSNAAPSLFHNQSVFSGSSISIKTIFWEKKKRFLLHAFSFYSPFLSQTHLIRLLPSPLHQSCSCHFFITMPMVLSPYSAC